jgi:hypothetical protein
MTGPTEYWLVEWVQYVPNQENVLLGGRYVIVGASGKSVGEFQNVLTNQTALMASAPEGASTWGDQEVCAVVEDQLAIPCVFPEPPAPPTPEPLPEA